MTNPSYWAVVPAAGVGRRFGAERPKQYLKLGPRAILFHTLDVLLRSVSVRAVMVALAEDDQWWSDLGFDTDPRIIQTVGGPERCHSVLNALKALLEAGADPCDRVLVHDAVRPCLRVEDIDHLIEAVGDNPNGGLLALPMNDTVKLADGSGFVSETVSRERLWRALTPQLFEIERLSVALNKALAGGTLVTDEAQAMENSGYHPKLVEGSMDNIKVTRRDDLAIAEVFLRQQGRL